MGNHIGNMSNSSNSSVARNAIEVANTFTPSTMTMKNAVACNETVIDDEQNNGHVSRNR